MRSGVADDGGVLTHGGYITVVRGGAGTGAAVLGHADQLAKHGDECDHGGGQPAGPEPVRGRLHDEEEPGAQGAVHGVA